MPKDKIKYFIGIETLAANAFIKMMERDDSSSERYVITLRELNMYSKRVLETLNRNSKQAVIAATSTRDVMEVFRSESEYFVPATSLWDKAIALRKGVTIDELRKKFRTYLPSEVLAALIYVKI